MLKDISDKYEIINEISAGGMGTIYKANQKSLNRTVAIKVLHAQFASDDSFVKRFQREALSMAKLEHPNIIRVYDVDIWEDIRYIVMEYINGQDLRTLIKDKGSFSPFEAIRIIRQVSLALDFAHQHSIIHRDIKPGNILIDKLETAKVGDFGIAAASDDLSITLTGQIIGTPEYMSPEQLRGDEVEEKMDIYSLGMVFYQMLAGKTPFEGLSKASIIGRIMNNQGITELDYPDHIPDDLRQIVNNFFAINSDSRYVSAKSVITDIDRFLNRHKDEGNINETCIMEAPVLSPEKKSSTSVSSVIKPQSPKKTTLPFAPENKKRIPFAFVSIGIIIFILIGAGYWYTTKGNYKFEFQGREQEIISLKKSAHKEKEGIERFSGITLNQVSFKQLKNKLRESDATYEKASGLYKNGEYMVALLTLTDAQGSYEKSIRALSAFKEEVRNEIKQAEALIKDLNIKAAAIRAETVSLGAEEVTLGLFNEADRLYEESKTSRKQGRFQEAIGLLKKTVRAFEETKVKVVEANAAQEKEKKAILEKKRQADRAKIAMDIARKQAEATSKTNSYQKAKKIAEKGDDAYKQEKYKSAVSLYRKARKKFNLAQVLVITQNDKRTLEKTIKRLIRAYEKRNLYFIKRISNLSSSKEALLKTIFNNYKSLDIVLEKTTFKKNIATSVLLIKSLINSTGDIVQPGANWQKNSLTIQFDENGWGKVQW